MKGYKSINQFDIQECDIFLQSHPNSSFCQEVSRRRDNLIKKELKQEEERKRAEMMSEKKAQEKAQRKRRIKIRILLVAIVICIITVINMVLPSTKDTAVKMIQNTNECPDGNIATTAAEVEDAEKTNVEFREAVAQKPQKTVTPVYVHVDTCSKQCYDLIAGFYLNKSTAAMKTAHFRELDCDAYIIEFNDLYYVSMGSASSQAAAEALLKNVKSWYDGDVVIKKW